MSRQSDRMGPKADHLIPSLLCLQGLCDEVTSSLSTDTLGPEPEPLPLHPSQRSSSVEVLTSSEETPKSGRVRTLRSGSTSRGVKEKPRRYSVIDGSDTQHKYKSQLLSLNLIGQNAPLPNAVGPDTATGDAVKLSTTYVAKKSSSKRMRCEVSGAISGGSNVVEGEVKAAKFSRHELNVGPVGDSVSSSDRATREGYTFEWPMQAPSSFKFGLPSGIRASKSDYHLHMESTSHTPAATTTLNPASNLNGPLPLIPVGRIPPSASLPLFPLSQPRKVKGEDKPSARGEDTPVSRPQHLQNQFAFSNPRTLQRGKIASGNSTVNSGSTNEQPPSTSVAIHFKCSRKTSERNEANPLDELHLANFENDDSHTSAVPPTPVQALSTPAHSDTPLEAHRSSTFVEGYDADSGADHSTISEAELDKAFLQTPYLPSRCSRVTDTPSPNLLEKIELEIASRHQFSPCTPSLITEASVKVNDSYREAVLGQEDLLPAAHPTCLEFDGSFGGGSEREDTTENACVASDDLETTKATGAVKPGLTLNESGVQALAKDGCQDELEKSKSDHRHDSDQVGSPLGPHNANNTDRRSATPERKPPVVQFKHSTKRVSGHPPHTPRGFVFSLPSPWSGRHRESTNTVDGGMKLSK